MNNEYKITEIETDLFEIDINGEIVLINIAGTSIQKDLENMLLIKEDNEESFHGYLIKSAKKWITTRKKKTDHLL
jgi:hypothetical protein